MVTATATTQPSAAVRFVLMAIASALSTLLDGSGSKDRRNVRGIPRVFARGTGPRYKGATLEPKLAGAAFVAWALAACTPVARPTPDEGLAGQRATGWA